MKQKLIRALLVLGMMLAAGVLVSPARAQQADEDPSPSRTNPKQQPSNQQQQPSGKSVVPPPTPSSPSAVDPQTQDELAFNGIVTKVRDKVVLRDPVTKVVYNFDDPGKVEPYLGKHVKVVGKLGLNTNTIHVNTVEVIARDLPHRPADQTQADEHPHLPESQ